ncbi:MAG TPA: hypothetical protein VGC93_11995 [Thermoanaerobaculia bacterium]
MDTGALQNLWWLTGAIFYAVSAVAVLCAAWKYLVGLDQRSAETLVQLEARFADLTDIARAVDPEAHEFEGSGLAHAVQKGLDAQWDTRDDKERALMRRLDAFLRFLQVLGTLERNRLLNRRALWDTYHYWFRAIDTNPMLRRYINLHFPVLNAFLRRNARHFEEYWKLEQRSREEVKVQGAMS